jgi:hypothetical protein
VPQRPVSEPHSIKVIIIFTYEPQAAHKWPAAAAYLVCGCCAWEGRQCRHIHEGDKLTPLSEQNHQVLYAAYLACWCCAWEGGQCHWVDALVMRHLRQQEAQAIALHNKPAAAAAAEQCVRKSCSSSSSSSRKGEPWDAVPASAAESILSRFCRWKHSTAQQKQPRQWPEVLRCSDERLSSAAPFN